jgi:hypothetical protein
MKENRGDESIEVIIHIYMETSQKNLLVELLPLSQRSKNVLFLSVFFCIKLENRRMEQVLPREDYY